MNLTEEQQEIIFCDCNAADPVALHEADLTKSFVYQRDIGVMYVPFAAHQQIMAFLMAFKLGYDCFVDAGRTFDKHQSMEELADMWLETTEGSAYRSGMDVHYGNASVRAWSKSSLNATEKRLFRNLRYFVED